MVGALQPSKRNDSGSSALLFMKLAVLRRRGSLPNSQRYCGTYSHGRVKIASLEANP
jgi:hypothetical protein